MKRFGRVFVYVFIAFIAVCLLIFPKAVAKAAYSCMIQCGGTVIPALLPFLILSGFAIRVIRPRSAVVTTLLTGLLGGYPVGAISASQLVRDGYCSRNDAAKIAGVCSTASPGFIFGAAGGNLSLFLACLLGCLVVGIVFDRPKFTRSTAKTSPVSPISALTESISSGVVSVATICGYVIFFGVIAAIFEFLGYFPNHPLFYGTIELTAGIARLNEISALPFRSAVTAWLLCSGGVSAQLQCVCALRSEFIPIKPYFLRRLVASAVAAVSAAALAFL